MTKVQKIPYEQFIQIYSQVPRLCVELVLVSDEGVLLTKRNIEPAKGMWHLPGGTILKGETVEESVKRVANEELGITVDIVELIGYCEFERQYTVGQAVSLVFLVKKVEGEIRVDEQADEFGFFKKLPESTIPDTRKFLQKFVLK